MKFLSLAYSSGVYEEKRKGDTFHYHKDSSGIIRDL